MSTAKHYLKLTKGAIEANDPELALEYVEDVLEADQGNYLAYIFRGKAHQLLKQLDKANEAFAKATSIEPDNALGWKGYFQVVKSQDNYKLFFQVLAQFLRVQMQLGQSLVETLDDAMNYLKVHKLHENPELYELYLKSIIPGSELHDILSGSGTSYFGTAEENLQKLIDLLLKQIRDTATKAVAKERMKLPKQLNFEQQKKLNQLIWPIYENNSLSDYFDQFLNICNDDDTRIKYQELYLMYKHEMLQISPVKQSLLKEVKSMCDDLVLLKVPSLFVWMLYFDLMDFSNFYQLQKDHIVFVIKHFQNEGLAVLLYGFIQSEISPFDAADIFQDLNPKSVTATKNTSDDDIEDKSADLGGDDHEYDEDDELLKNVEVENNEEALIITDTLSPDQVLTFMKEGFERCSESVFANRIVINYYIHLREYVEASDRCRNGIKMLADLQRSIGADLSNSREDIICSLAVVYTYYEVPKNFGRALELYERILQNNRLNKRARIGKGLILMEKGDLTNAHILLKEVTTEFPEDPDALMEYGWCSVQLQDHELGRECLSKALQFIKSHDLQSAELRAKINWRLSKSHLMMDTNNIEIPYELLIKSLKEFKNFAPSYTSLGVIYLDNFHDKARAQKCFYKAFELDVAEVISARYLVEDLASKNEWEVAEILCSRIVETERSRRSLKKEADNSWPYRVLGCSALNKQDDAKAIEWFQTALRMAAMDFECWVGLGEAYYNCGRLDAAQKVFQRALTLKEDDWTVVYMLGKVLCDLKEFDEGISKLQNALALKPNEECILNALFQSKINQTKKLMDGGFFGRVLVATNEAIDLILQCSKINIKSQSLWLSLHRCLKIYLKIQQDLKNYPFPAISKIIQSFEQVGSYNDPFLDELSDTDKNLNFSRAVSAYESGRYIESICCIIILTFKISIHLLPNQGRYIRSINYYNLGLAYYESFICDTAEEHLEFRNSAVMCFKRAIQLEGRNSNFWVALGNTYSTYNPQISQHCFIKAISLESRDGDIWNNLAALYLKYGDTELAQEAYLRSQSVSPEQSQAWLGHALTAKANNNLDKSFNLFTHAFTLSNGRSPLAQLLYALSIINKRIGTGSDPRDIETAQEFSIANFAIQSYLRFYPNDLLGLKIALTISERCKSFEVCCQVGEKLCSLLEQQYEETESEKVLKDFINAKCQLARIYLATERYDRSIEEASMVLDLLSEEGNNEDDIDILNKLSAQVTIGLAYFFLKDLNKSIDQLKVILGSHNNSKTLITLTAQILNAFNTEETKQAALDQLFSFIEDNGSSLIIVLTLGAIALKDELVDILPAVRDELNNLPLVEIVNDSFRAVPKLLRQINQLLEPSSSISGSGKIWERSAILFPQDYSIWAHINNQMALSIAHLNDTKLNSSQMSNAYIMNGTFRDVQRGIILSPANSNGWTQLKKFIE